MGVLRRVVEDVRWSTNEVPEPQGCALSHVNDQDRRKAEWRTFQRVDAAFRAGDLDALRAAIPDQAMLPDGWIPAIGRFLEYAIYHSPLPFIRTLLEMGADPNPSDHSGFPPLIAALACTRAAPGSTPRDDVDRVIRLLLEFGADPNQRGVNDYTPLHMAVAEGNAPAVQILLDAGADPDVRTRIDDCETPLEMARKIDRSDMVGVLERMAGRRTARGGRA